MRHALCVMIACLAVSALLALPATGAGPHLEPGTVVAGDGPGGGLLVHLYVQSGHKDAQAVYVVQRVGRCADPGGPGWYGASGARLIRSAPELEMRERIESLCPCQLPLPGTCASSTGAGPARTTGWDRLVDGTFEPFGPIAFPPFARA